MTRSRYPFRFIQIAMWRDFVARPREHRPGKESLYLAGKLVHDVCTAPRLAVRIVMSIREECYEATHEIVHGENICGICFHVDSSTMFLVTWVWIVSVIRDCLKNVENILIAHSVE